MAQCVKRLVAYDRRFENEYQYRRSRIGKFVNSNYNEEMANVLRFTTHYVAGHIEKHFSLDPNDPHVIRVQSVVKQHTLRDDDWRCNCEFSMSLRLPCGHAIAFRKSSKVRQFSYERFKDPAVPGERKTNAEQPHKDTKKLAGYIFGGYGIS
ncbi:hypothetical protein PHMEG_0009836 [Phytophthora megakarya]|uniref:SWIM-type domain-containing protein n=1 Tax=Phytophthora megakarya TaxID=4795 RepID=A0A225WF83_9STRA|nr:hypothetical protein PHMEG_0009836 [Phytophthora megakarya]